MNSIQDFRNLKKEVGEVAYASILLIIICIGLFLTVLAAWIPSGIAIARKSVNCGWITLINTLMVLMVGSALYLEDAHIDGWTFWLDQIILGVGIAWLPLLLWSLLDRKSKVVTIPVPVKNGIVGRRKSAAVGCNPTATKLSPNRGGTSAYREQAIAKSKENKRLSDER